MFHQQWQLTPGDQDREQPLALAAGCSSLLARLLFLRGVRTGEEARVFLGKSLKDLHEPELLPDMDRAVSRISEALRNHETIGIYGDYDVDGVTATALLVKFFRLLQREVPFTLSHRLREGYGLSEAGLQRLADQGVRLVVTVDCGMGNEKEIAAARTRGMEIIVTDHHEGAQPPPSACAAVTAKRADARYPFRDLAGVGIAFKLALALSQRLSGAKKVSDEFRRFLLDATGLVALGTIADVVPLRGENRLLVSWGLESLSQSQDAGLLALRRSARLDKQLLSVEDVGFRLGPRINAAGRLGDALAAANLLLARSEADAAPLAHQLEDHNRQRQSLEKEVLDDINRQLQEADHLKHRALLLAGDRWHPGVIGIVAARLAETHARPVLLVSWDGAQGRGSSRSVPDLHLYQALGACRANLLAYGGHARAAGFRVERSRWEDFCREFQEKLPPFPSPSSGPLILDAACPLHALSRDLLKELDRLEPHGEENPAPLLLSDPVEGKNPVLDRKGRHLFFWARSENASFRAILFGGSARLPELAAPGTKFRLAYRPRLSTYMGRTDLELEVTDFAPASHPVPGVP